MATSQQLVAAAKAAWEKYRDQIAEVLGVNAATIPEPVFRVAKLGQGEVANTDASSGTITIDPSWDPSDVGAIVHEAVHLVQNIPGGNDAGNSRYTEAVADAVRYQLLGNSDSNWTPSKLALQLASLSPEQLRAFSTAQMSGQDPVAALRAQAATPTLPALTPQQLSNMTPEQIAAYNAASGAGGSSSDPFGLLSGGGLSQGQTKADQKAEQQQNANERSGFLTQLQLLGIQVTPDMRALVQHATQQNYSFDRFMYFLRQTDEYQQSFPGIFEKDGTLKMTEQQYLANKKAYESYASQAGLQLNDKKIGWLFQHDVSPDEYADRAPAIRMLKDNQEFYTQFARGLVQSGLATQKEVNEEGLFKFVLGEGNAAWYKELNLAQARYAATQAGVDLGKPSVGMYSHIAPNQIQKIADKGLTPDQLKAGFEQTAQDLLTTLPLSRIQKYGLTKRDILQARFGGKKQAEVLQLMQHIQEQEKAFYGDRASASMYATAQGVETLGGSGERAGQ